MAPPPGGVGDGGAEKDPKKNSPTSKRSESAEAPPPSRPSGVARSSSLRLSLSSAASSGSGGRPSLSPKDGGGGGGESSAPTGAGSGAGGGGGKRPSLRISLGRSSLSPSGSSSGRPSLSPRSKSGGVCSAAEGGGSGKNPPRISLNMGGGGGGSSGSEKKDLSPTVASKGGESGTTGGGSSSASAAAGTKRPAPSPTGESGAPPPAKKAPRLSLNIGAAARAGAAAAAAAAAEKASSPRPGASVRSPKAGAAAAPTPAASQPSVASQKPPPQQQQAPKSTKPIARPPVERFDPKKPSHKALSSSAKTEPCNATASDCRLLHQRTHLSFCYRPPTKGLGGAGVGGEGVGGRWGYEGVTTLWVLDESDDPGSAQNLAQGTAKAAKKSAANSSAAPKTRREVALHLRGGIEVLGVTAEAYGVGPAPASTTKGGSGAVNRPEAKPAKPAGGVTDDEDEAATAATKAAAGTPPSPKKSAEATTKEASAATTTGSLRPLPTFHAHFDPLQKVLLRPPHLFDSECFLSDPEGGIPRRYEADCQSSRGGAGFADALRCASAASAGGELRVVAFAMGLGGGGNAVVDGGSAREAGTKAQEKAERVRRRRAEAAWRDSILRHGACAGGIDDSEATLSARQGRLARSLRARLDARPSKSRRRTDRAALVAKRLAAAPPGAALKITVRFALPGEDLQPGRAVHRGGLHVLAPPAAPPAAAAGTSGGVAVPPSTGVLAPHVYTSAGVHGDHQGVRTFLPTLDSAGSRHRSSHEVTVSVTGPVEEGLWAAGFGEDFGCNDAVLHGVPRGGAATGLAASVENGTRVRLERALGQRHSIFLAEFFATYAPPRASVPVPGALGGPHVIPPDGTYRGQRGFYHRRRRVGALPPELATAVFVTSSWSPIPSRSVGLAVAPFKILYDPEYYGLVPDDDDDEDDEGVAKSAKAKAEEEDEEPRATLEDAALRRGEGVRQLYVCPVDERADVHGEAPVLGEDDVDWDWDESEDVDDEMGATGSGHRRRRQRHPDGRRRHRARPRSVRSSSSALLKSKRDIELSLLASTVGVPNRALSLTRDVLRLPSYRTSSHTQIWLPRAVDGGTTSGTLRSCPESSGGLNPFLGGAVLDSALLPPPGCRVPYYAGGRALQFAQARSAVRGWITSALPLGGADEIGQGYLHSVVESLLMSLYERGHGAFGEGGGRGGFFHTSRYAIGSGLNSPNLDFLPIKNVLEEDLDAAMMMGFGGVGGGAAIEERGNDHLWRTAANGTEYHTSALDESSIRQLLNKDVLETLERSDRLVPLPSMGWAGSYLSATCLTSNAASSSAVGCGAVELMHPIGGGVYRALKSESLRRMIEARVGITTFVRVVRAAFVAALLEDAGEEKLQMPEEKKKPKRTPPPSATSAAATSDKDKTDQPGGVKPKAVHPPEDEPEQHFVRPKPSFIVCVEELIKKGGLTHMLFTRALRILAGPIREPYLRGSLVDIDRTVRDVSSARQLVEPEGFPNSYVRGASSLYVRLGVHVEPAGSTGTDTGPQGSASGVKGIHLHVFAEPVVPEGGTAFGGPVALRLIENGGQCREFVRTLKTDGSRTDWGPIFLHAEPVVSAKQQMMATGAIEKQSTSKKKGGKNGGGEGGSSEGGDSKAASATGAGGDGVFTSTLLHGMGYQALELIRLTNRTPLLWIRIDPHGMYDGRIAVVQPDASYGEQMYHDGDAAGQIEAIRALAERPLRIQGSVNITSVFDVPVAELPVRLLGDCLRGSATLQSDLPHTPAVRAQAALAIGQWQNNKAPNSCDAVGADSWVGLDLLLQYFRERFGGEGDDMILPVRFSTHVLKQRKVPAGAAGDDAEGDYEYLDSYVEAEERKAAINEAGSIEIEENEEYRVRSAVITAIASVRAKDGMTPAAALRFLESILRAWDDGSVPAGNPTLSPQEEKLIRKKRLSGGQSDQDSDEDDVANKSTGMQINRGLDADAAAFSADEVEDLPYVTSSLVADALLALCHVHVRPALIDDPATGRQVQSKGHPIMQLMAACHRWLEWDLYKEDIRSESALETKSDVGGGCRSAVSACAITALFHLALLRQSTTDVVATAPSHSPLSPGYPNRKRGGGAGGHKKATKSEEAATAGYYSEIFDSRPPRADSTRAAAAQAVACICCAADRIEKPGKDEPLGLLTSLDFMLDRILEPTTSPGLRHTLSSIMLDAVTGKVCCTHRSATIGGGRSDLPASGSRFYAGPLGATYGGDNGSAVLTSPPTDAAYPAAAAVNDGARRGLRLLTRAGRDGSYGEAAVVRVAAFATKLWRTMNGEEVDVPARRVVLVDDAAGICAYDGHLRCSLMSVWQWIWPKDCIAVLRVQSWKSLEGTKRYRDLGADRVMKTTDEEREATAAEEVVCSSLKNVVSKEIDRQKWRGEMAMRAYDYSRRGESKDSSSATGGSAAQGLDRPLPAVHKDAAWKVGGWTASAALQRRAKGADGGGAVTKLRLTVKSTTGD